jgi:adenylate cyclase
VTEERAKRKLAAILSADVKGYSRLMEEDELATVRTLEAYRELITEVIRNYSGRVVDSPGDNLLAEFVSVVDAVECAVEIQKEVKERNKDLPGNRRMLFRIGINLGDVIQEGERIYGDGVNIAARIESLAAGGGICISGTAFDHVEGKLGLKFEYLGKQSVKNIRKPVRVYQVEMATRVSGFGMGGELPFPDKPSIAVLPFVNMSGDPAQEYIGDGLSENIISALSISSKMFVIARNSTFSYKGKAVKVQQVAEEMGVQYVLEGSVQKSGDRLRVTAQLIDALSGHHLWSDRYDRKLIELFDLQDEITKKIVTSLQVKLTHGEAARWAERTTENFEAWSYFVKGRELYMKFGKEDNAKARELLEAATELDPDYAYAWGVLGGTHLMDAWSGWSESPINSMKLGRDYVQKSLELDGKSPVGHGLLGHLYLMKGEHEKAMAEHKKTLSFHPNHDMGHFDLGATMCFSGRFEESIELIEKAMRLSPYYPAIYLYCLGINYVSLKRFEEAIETFTQLDERCQKGDLPTWYAYRGLAECYWELGRKEEAREYLAKLLKANPKWSLESLKMDPFPFKDPALVQPRIEIFRELGAPEKLNLPLPDKPSIAVLPFVNMSDDPEQEYFSDGITEDIITNLSKVSGLFVISRNSSFLYKGKQVKIQEVARDLGVHYVLEGSVRRAGPRVRITAQLIDGKTEHHVWAEKYDRELKDIFSVQDEVTKKVVSELAVSLTANESDRLERKHTNNFKAYEMFLRARRETVGLKKENYLKAIEMSQRVIELDPNFAGGYAWLSYVTGLGVRYGYSISPSQDVEKAFAMAKKAVSVDETYGGSYIALADAYMMKRKHDHALSAINTAVSIQPGDAYTHLFLGWYLHWAGRGEEAIEAIKKAQQLDPRYQYARTPAYLDFMGAACFTAGLYEESIANWKKAMDRFGPEPVRQAFITASYSELGRGEEAISMAKQLLKTDPRFSLSSWNLARLYKNPEDTERLLDALRRAGLK